MFAWRFFVRSHNYRAAWLAAFFLLACALARAADAPHPMAERTAACTACHGAQGKAGPDGYYPRLAGKPAGYLYNQLRNFQEGRRHYTLMAGLLAPLGPDYLRDMATYFSNLEVPYPAPVRSSAPAAVLERGKTLVLQGDRALGIPACVLCHGQALTGVAPTTPGLLGLPRDYLNAQLGGWQTGQRKAHAPDCMADIARKLGVDDLNAATQWLSSQPLPASTKPATQRPSAIAGALVLPPCGSAP